MLRRPFEQVKAAETVSVEFARQVLSTALPNYAMNRMGSAPVRVFLVHSTTANEVPVDAQFSHFSSRWMVFLPSWSGDGSAWQKFALHHGVCHAAFSTAAQLEEGWSTFKWLAVILWAMLFVNWSSPSLLMLALSALALFAINLQWDIVPGARLSRFFDEWQVADELALGELSIAELMKVEAILRARDLSRPGPEDDENDYLNIYRLSKLSKLIRTGRTSSAPFVSSVTQKKSAVYFAAILGLSLASQALSTWKVWLVATIAVLTLLFSKVMWWSIDSLEHDVFVEINRRSVNDRACEPSQAA